MSTSPFYSDLHVHTNNSFCAPRDTTVASYIPHCEAEGIRLIGISDHVYPTEIIRNNGFPGEDRLSRLTKLRPELEAAQESSGIKFLLGCEIDYFPSVGHPYILPEESTAFDYVMLAASHILNYSYMYSDYDLDDPDVVRRLTVERFIAACELQYPVPMAICHPLYPICSPHQEKIIAGISDACLNECFSMAAERNISIEIHACLYRNDTPLNACGLSDSYLRVLSAAKACGCKFHFGSDAHTPSAFTGVHDRLRTAADILGITEDDLWDVAKL